MPLPSMYVFGPQVTKPSSEYLFQLRATLLLEPRLQTLLGTIRELPDLWQTLLYHDPRLRVLNGERSLATLQTWLNHGGFSTDDESVPNVLSMPLTVIIQLVQYTHFLANNPWGATHEDLKTAIKKGGIQGFCLGLLTAVAVAASTDETDLANIGSVALRLALCIGAYVDLDGAINRETSSLAVRWSSISGHNHVLDILKDYEDVGFLLCQTYGRNANLRLGLHLCRTRHNGRQYNRTQRCFPSHFTTTDGSWGGSKADRPRWPLSFKLEPLRPRKASHPMLFHIKLDFSASAMSLGPCAV